MAFNIQFPCSRKLSGGKDKHCADFLAPLSGQIRRRIRRDVERVRQELSPHGRWAQLPLWDLVVVWCLSQPSQGSPFLASPIFVKTVSLFSLYRSRKNIVAWSGCDKIACRDKDSIQYDNDVLTDCHNDLSTFH